MSHWVSWTLMQQLAVTSSSSIKLLAQINMLMSLLTCSWDSSVGIVTGYGLDSPGLIPGSARFFSSPQHPYQLWGSPSLLSNGYWGLLLQGREADHSPSYSAEVKNGGPIPPLPHMSSWHSA
jgi:hypothetical protein